MTVASLLVDLRPPEGIRYGEIVTFWTRLPFRLWCDSYTVWLSPNRDLNAWTNDTMQRIALLWDIHTGKRYQVNREALHELVNDLGGWS